MASISTLPPPPAAWALQLPLREGAQLGVLRLTEGIEVGVDSESLWLRGRERNESLDTLLRALPAKQRYHWQKDDALRPVESRLAFARFPTVSWQPLRSWLQVALPVAHFPAIKPPAVNLRLVASSEMRPANAAVIALRTWTNWAQRAPELRLKPLRFATEAEGRCLILGAPLPSVPGRLFVAHEGIVIPAGTAWAPAVSPLTLRRLFTLADQDLILWDESGIRHLSSELIVPASRANARATADGFRPSSP